MLTAETPSKRVQTAIKAFTEYLRSSPPGPVPGPDDTNPNTIANCFCVRLCPVQHIFSLTHSFHQGSLGEIDVGGGGGTFAAL